MSDADAVLSFWLEPKPDTEEAVQARFKLWFVGGAEVDRQLKERFAELVERARKGELDDWAKEARSRLALIILLDQFSRNLFRGSKDAFAQDPKALELSRTGLDSGLFDGFDSLDRLFCYLPFSHAEDLDMQRRAVRLSVAAVADAPPAWKKPLVGAVDFARKHLDVIARFGRFPHRNETLGRVSTAEEKEYLVYLKDAGQWL